MLTVNWIPLKKNEDVMEISEPPSIIGRKLFSVYTLDEDDDMDDIDFDE